MSINGVGTRSSPSIASLVQMRQQLDDLQRQLATGQKSTTYAGLGLDRGLAVGLRSRLSALGGYDDAIANVGVRISLANTSLSRISEIGRTVKSATQISPFDADGSGKTTAQRTAMSQLDEILGLLNTQSADRYLYGGRDVTHPPVETTARVIDGDATHAGFKQVMAERNLADIGTNGLGRLVASAPVVTAAQFTGTGASLSPDAVATVTGNVDLAALATAGGTLEINGTSITINAGNVASVLNDINTQQGVTGVQATQDVSGFLVLTSADADTPVDIGAASAPAQLLADLGIVVGNNAPVNLLTQGAVSAGQTLTLTIGANAPLSITFGNGSGEVSTLAELNAALGTLAGGSASVNLLNGNISVTATASTDLITIGGTASPTAFGIPALVTGPTGAYTLSEDAAGSPFGFKFTGVNSTIAGISGPTGAPAAVSINLTSNPSDGQSLRIDFALPDGSTESLILAATTTVPPGAGQFAIGASPAATADNLRTALTTEIGNMARTSLSAASAIAAAHDFFDVDVGQPPQRVAGPPFDTATALTAGTSANTVFWYTGEMGADPARGTAVARADEAVAVSYGMRANEEALRWTLEHVAVFATMTYSASDPDAKARYQALNQRLGPALDGPGGVQTIEGIQADLAGAQTSLQAAKQRHLQVNATLESLLSTIEGVSNEEVGAKILSLQTRLQASLQTTALIFRTSIIDYL